MQIPLQITFRDLPQSAAIEAKIRETAGRLDHFSDRIMSCRVTVSETHRRHHRGKLYHVSIDLTVPGGELVVNREPELDHAHEDVYVAIRDAFKAARRQVEDHVRKSSAYRVKPHQTPRHGRIVRIFGDEGYGFIATPDGQEIYFHRNSVVEGGWDKLDLDVEVRFTEAEGEKGPHAVSVAPVVKGEAAE